ncbi:hypothetical protein [Halovulum sp. GXIMD14793]
MKHILALTFAITLAGPALTQDEKPPVEQRHFLDRYLEDRMRDLAEELQRELTENLQPELERLMGEMLPRLRELTELVGGLQYYEMPEILPNGDILIRRKSDAPPFEGLPGIVDKPIDL